MTTPILVASIAGVLVLLFIFYRLRESRRRRARRGERKARYHRRRAHQFAWDMVMRRNGTRRLTDQRDMQD
jgi:DNA-binding transcriptional regulator PaaX